MDPLDTNFIPPPAYCEEEFDQKTSRATELSLELAKWETPKIEIDEEGFPRYDPSMFEDPPRAQKGKDQPTLTTFRSSSISKRPLPNPKSAMSSTDAGPSTMRQTQPLHISKKSISKAEEAAFRDIRPSIKYTPEDIPPYAAQNLPAMASSLQSIPDHSSEDTSEDNPPYTAMDPHAAIASSPDQSIEDASEDNPPYTAMDPQVSTSSIPDQSIEDTLEEDNPPYENNYLAQPPYDEQSQLENWEDSTTPRQEVISEPVPDNRPQSSELELPEHLRQDHDISTPNTATMANQMFNRQSRYSVSPNPPFHRGPQLLNPNSATMSNQMLDTQPQYSMARNPQHFSLPPAPRTLPQIHPSDRPRSQSTIPMSPSSALSQRPPSPRVLFNPNVAYGKNPMVGQVPQFRPKTQTPHFQARYDPTTFYNAAVSSHLGTPTTIPDQSPHPAYPVQRRQVWPNQTLPTPANAAINQSHQWGWHPPGRPSNTYHSVTDTSYGGGGTDVARYSHYPVTNNGYFNQ